MQDDHFTCWQQIMHTNPLLCNTTTYESCAICRRLDCIQWGTGLSRNMTFVCLYSVSFQPPDIKDLELIIIFFLQNFMTDNWTEFSKQYSQIHVFRQWRDNVFNNEGRDDV